MTAEPDLSVIVPVHNGQEAITELVRAFLDITTISVEVIVVDDHSSDATLEVLRAVEATDPRLVVKSHRMNRGAGIARNTGFAHATGRYTLFFDDDDIAHPEAISAVVAALDETDADLAITPYRYRRGGTARHETMNHGDVEIWRTYLGTKQRRVGRLDTMAGLCGLSNYPWNKVLRTETYRKAGLRFGSTPVHNDILGHWYSLLFARDILLLDRVICTHVVEDGGSNLTNMRTRARLTLFDALDETYDLLARYPEKRNRYSHHYWASVIRIAAWAQDRIGPELRDDFNLRLQRHLLRVNLADYARIRLARDPALATAIARRALT